ncbi:MAG: hypothetical protein OEV91_03150, partial [Desulfobulbaceae bacterium]|nr:hypothetical protein [Desulfobulbaceae bacterium]
MKKTMTCWAICGLGLVLLMGAGCAPTITPKNEAAAMEPVEKTPSVSVHVLQVNSQKPATGVTTKEGAAPSPAVVVEDKA